MKPQRSLCRQGGEVAGDVDAVGEGVSNVFSVGDRCIWQT